MAPDAEPEQVAIDDAYRAVGRYVVEFSQLVGRMRNMLAERVARDGAPIIVPELALSEATAQQMSNAFFGACRFLGKFDDDEEKVVEAWLRNRVVEVIEKRNDIAHGDWWVGFPAVHGRGIEPSLLIRIRPLAKEFEKVADVTAADLDTQSESIISLINTLEEFGRLALGLPLKLREARPPARGGRLALQGEYRVRDIYTKPGGKKGPVVRDGPKAEELSANYYPTVLTS